MSNHSEAFVAFDTSKLRNAIAIADGGRAGEVRFLGEIENTEAATAKLVRRLAAKYQRLTFCYEAGPTGYGLYRQIKGLGHECIVVAPSMIPKRPGDHVKTNRRDAVSLAKLLRADELTPVWVPDRHHEAMRDLTRRARRRLWICGRSVSRYRHSCCGRGGIIRSISRRGPRRIGAG
jgi:transposase